MDLSQDLRDALVGTTLAGTSGVRYHLREILGEGGQGWIYKANYKEPNGFWVVVKVLRPERAQDEALSRFEREADVLRMLGSLAPGNPNIVRFFDFGAHDVDSVLGEVSLPFIVLEYVDGQTLEQVIRAHGGFGLPVARVMRVMRQVARALQTVHDHRIIHRDLKPSNILLAQIDGMEVAKVTDFGLVKLTDVGLVRTGNFAGASLGYAPPEQYEMGNTRVSVQTDVFSFATILYEALSGQEAFPCKPGDNAFRVMSRMQTADRPSLARVSATISRELRDRPDLTAAVDRELARATGADPAARHTSIRELWMRVEPLLREVTQPPTVIANNETSGARNSSSISLPGAADPMPAWQLLGPPLAGEQLRAGAFAGRSVIAIGSRGLYHFAHGIWSAMHLPPSVDARLIRSLVRLPNGRLLLFGDLSLVTLISPAGEPERVILGERDMTLLGAHADEEGILLVGEKLSKSAGVVVDWRRGTSPVVRVIEGTSRLHGVTRLTGGAILACGTHGALVEIHGSSQREIPWGRTGHLFAVAAAPEGGAFVVGSGGHALYVSPPAVTAGPGCSATLEAVQTTRDLRGVVLDAMGRPWAIGTQARLMQRRKDVWMRIPLDPMVRASLVVAGVREDSVTVVSEDGSVFEAPLPAASA
ncbi:MAG TPA: serine/threonine-protein kinase [Polyangiaceae bacterium]|nr:serine/threonine-protein kinase [Polyangiaceae bacterium]